MLEWEHIVTKQGALYVRLVGHNAMVRCKADPKGKFLWQFRKVAGFAETITHEAQPACALNQSNGNPAVDNPRREQNVRKILAISAMLTVAALTACATPPDQIKPAAYAASQPCRSGDLARLATISEQQGAKARADAVGVLIVGLPVGSLGSKVDHKREIAEIKARCRV